MTTEYDADSLLEADGTTKMARNGKAGWGGTTANGGIAAFNVNDVREANARREGVTRDMCEECSVLCNR